MRKTSLEEMPQLWYVFVGDISLAWVMANSYRSATWLWWFLPYYESVHYGISGFWQVSRRNERTFEQRFYWDNWYIKNWFLRKDVVILFKIVGILLTGRGAYYTLNGRDFNFSKRQKFHVYKGSQPEFAKNKS